MFRKFIITVICCLSIFALCAVPSYAAGFGGGHRGGGFGSGGFSSNTVSTYLSYDALSDLCAEVNYNLERNVYASDGFPASGKYAATIVSRSDGYYIGVYKAGSYTWFRNPSGGFYICDYNTDSLLSNLYSVFLTRFDWNFSNFVSHLDDKLAPLSDISSSLSSFYKAFLTRMDWNFSNFVTHFDEKIDPLSNSASAGVGYLNSINSKLNNLPGSSPSDLTSVTMRLDTIIEQLQTTSGESGCDHTYAQDVTQAPTCILPGLQVSTCSQCGDSYSEILAALGHDWQCTSHVEAVTDPDTGEVTQSGYDIYTCSRCGDTYNDYAGDGAPSDYGDTSLSKIIVKLFSKLGTFAGKIISWIIGLFDKMLSGLNDIITRFSDLTAQITGFGGAYPSWLSGFWGILPQEFQLALTFSFVCVFIGVIGRKLFFV